VLNRVRELFLRAEPQGSLTAEPQPLVGKLRATAEGTPIQLDFGGRSLRLYPERRLNGDWPAAKGWILVDGERYANEICGFLRIGRGDRIELGRGDEACQRLFAFSAEVRRRQLEIANDAGSITLTRLDASGETYVHHVEDAEEIARPAARRLASLETIRRIFGGPIELLPPDQALATLRQVNEILRDEAYRPRDVQGRPGGLVDLPGDPVPVIVGDLHANVDNLLKVLSENACLESLCSGEANLIMLGDAIHPHGDGDLTEMETSLLILDLIFKLKIRFPRNVFYVRGNHDSFDEAVGKGGVPQGVILERRARELRGRPYAEELAEFFELLPYVVRTKHFIACHAGPPRREAALADLVNIRNDRGLAWEIAWNRFRRPNHLSGYTKRDVGTFRTKLGVAGHTPLIVGHTPLSSEETLWLDAGNIPNHHIVFSANPHNLSVFVRLGEDLVPLEYPAEPLLDLTNRLVVAEQGHAAPVG